MSHEDLKALRALIKDYEWGKHLTLRQAAERLGCTVWYLRHHLNMFPNAWRLGGTEIRIPVRDIEAATIKYRINKPKQENLCQPSTT